MLCVFTAAKEGFSFSSECRIRSTQPTTSMGKCLWLMMWEVFWYDRWKKANNSGKLPLLTNGITVHGRKRMQTYKKAYPKITLPLCLVQTQCVAKQTPFW